MINRNGIVLILLIVCFAGISIFFYLKLPKTAYVNTELLYDDFKLKKELEGKLIKFQNNSNHMLDSMMQQLKFLSEKIETEKLTKGEEVVKFNVLSKDYMLKKEQFEQQTQQLSQQYTDQIWKQLNQFIKEYGMKNSYDYIYGAHGQGNLLYAKEGDNITEEIKKYINGRYDGDIQ